MTERISLSMVPRELGLLGHTTKYRAVYNAALDGRIPAERATNSRWTVARADLPLIAATLCPRAPEPRYPAVSWSWGA